MSITDPHTLTALTDDALVARISSLTARARESTADLIGHLVELEKRNLHLALGFRSLYAYCRSLHFSESESYRRMDVAHVARRFPVVLPLLADGRLHLTAVRLLAPHLRDEDHLALLAGAFRKSRREIDVLLAHWFPKPDVPDLVRKLPRPRTNGVPSPPVVAQRAEATGTATPSGQSPAPEAADDVVVDKPAGDAAGSEGTASAQTAGAQTEGAQTTNADGSGNRPASAPRPGTIAPLAPTRYKVEFTAGETTIAKLRRAQELLSHAIPDGDLEAIFDRALDLVIEKGSRHRHSATKRAIRTKRASPARVVDPGSRSIPAEVERVVWDRDQGRCAFVGITGRRCDERRFLEFHHVKPWAASGPPTVENISLRCRAHNRYEAERYFGPIRDARSAEM